MKHKELKKLCCIFLLCVIVLPLFSNIISTIEGNTNKNDHSNSKCMHDKETILKKTQYSNYTGGRKNCYKLTSPHTCSDYYMIHNKKAHPCKTRITS